MNAEAEFKMAEQVSSGAAAEQELRLTGKAFAELQVALHAKWLATSATDTPGREKLWVATTILSQVEHALRMHVANGKVAEKNLEAIRKAGEPKSLRDRIAEKLS